MSSHAYNALRQEDSIEYFSNYEVFECDICLEDIKVNGGVILRNCAHQFCLEDLKGQIGRTLVGKVPCPEDGCEYYLEDREVRGIAGPELYATYVSKCLRHAAANNDNSVFCKTIDCNGWAIYEDKNAPFVCTLCGKTNCLICGAIHEDMSCETYQNSLRQLPVDETRVFQQKQVDAGKAIFCYGCKNFLTRNGGCDFIQCLNCGLEICFITKQRRWGPNGRGDISGGCRCGVEKICHPNCSHCSGHGEDQYG